MSGKKSALPLAGAFYLSVISTLVSGSMGLPECL